MSLLDDIYKERTRLAVGLKPLPRCYRFSPTTARRIIPFDDPRYRGLPVDMRNPTPGGSGHIFDIPFVVSAAVPDGEVWFTTDYETWHKVGGLG